MKKNNNWTKEETIIAFNVYCKIPFKSSSKSNSIIIKYANILGRSPSALNMKVGNFGRLDPELKKQGIVGLSHGSKLEEVVWAEFNGNWEKLAYESELLISNYSKTPIEDLVDNNFPLGVEREAMVKQRVNQSFFRSTILASYNSKCCVTGLSISELLVASHIIPWAKDENKRINPHNGLCLNSLHDKAFDRGLITITTDYHVKISNFFRDINNDESLLDLILKYDRQPILLPDKFLPSKDYLDYHNQNIFIK
ncbi:MAG: HNH endonuclease [Prolixibacteraceae bacterium]